MNKDSNWYKRMLEKFGSDEAISEVMRKNSNKSSRNKGGTFIHDPEKALEIQRKGGLARAEKIRAEKQSNAQSQDSDKEV